MTEKAAPPDQLKGAERGIDGQPGVERDGVGAMTVSAWRMVLAAIALLLFVRLTDRTGTLRRTMESWTLVPQS